MILKAKDIREKNEAELREELAKLRREEFDARMAFHARKLDSSAKLGQLRKSIARILTVLKEKELAQVA